MQACGARRLGLSLRVSEQGRRGVSNAALVTQSEEERPKSTNTTGQRSVRGGFDGSAG